MDKEFLIEPRFKSMADMNVVDVDEQKEETVEGIPIVDKTVRPELEYSGE